MLLVASIAVKSSLQRGLYGGRKPHLHKELMMETTAVSPPEHAHRLEVLQVRYPPAPKPFIDHHPDPSETIGSLRQRAKTFFGVADTTLSNGDRILFYLIFGRDRLEND